MAAGRHSAKAMVRACQLREPNQDGVRLGITFTVRQLEAEGFGKIAYNTVWAWTDEKFAARNARSKNRGARRRRAQHRAHTARPGIGPGPEWKLARMGELRQAGVSFAGIALVMGVDFPDDPALNADQVRVALRRNRPPSAHRPPGEFLAYTTPTT